MITNSSGFSIALDEETLRILMNKLKNLENIEQKKIIQQSLKKNARDMISVGKSNLASRNKVRKGNLRGSFTSKLAQKKKKGIYIGFKRPQGSAAHLVDRGTVDRYTKKGAYRGKVKGTYFWTDAVYSRQDDMMQNIVDDIIIQINNLL